VGIKAFLAQRRLVRQAIKQVYTQLAEEARKREQMQQLAQTPLNYAIIQDLVNTCAYTGVAARVTLKDGSRIEIVRKDAFDKLQGQREGELAGGSF